MWNYLKEIVFVRLIIPFSAGIISYVFIPIEFNLANTVAIFILSLLLLVFLHVHPVLNKSYRWRWMSGMAIFCCFFLAGHIFCTVRTHLNHDLHFSYHLQTDSRLILQLSEPVLEKEKSYKTIGKIKFLVNNDSIVPAFGQIIIYFKKDSSVSQLKYGDLLIINNKISALPDPQNPGEFNYKRFLSFRQIYHQAYLIPDDWIASDKNTGSKFIATIFNIRHRLAGILEDHLTDKNALAVASSLILGMREKLDDNIIKSYSSSGAMHVLAVSGLHVGIIFFIISKGLFFLDRNRKSKKIKSVHVVLFIWLYAAITGMSPSVLRASVMFSFIAAGKGLKRSTNSYNILAAAAFTLLLFNPYLIMEVGFQLSFAAVIGIVMLQPKLYALIYTPNYVLDKIWMITSVSIAAQLATFPIGLLYFHQFPVYFLVSNLFVIPAAMLILYGGMLLFMISWAGIVADALGYLLNKLIVLLNGIIFYIDSFPYSLIQGITVSVPESWFIYLALGSFITFFYNKRAQFLLTGFTSILILLAWNVFETVVEAKQRKFIVYNVTHASAIDFIHGKSHLFLSDSALLSDENKMLFHIRHNWWDLGIHNTIVNDTALAGKNSIKKRGNYIQFFDKRIVIIDEALKRNVHEKFSADYIIVSKNAAVNIADIIRNFDAEKIIFDSSNSRRKIKMWIQDCEHLNLDCYNVAGEGAYVANI